jgi:hypothetical protein
VALKFQKSDPVEDWQTVRPWAMELRETQIWKGKIL